MLEKQLEYIKNKTDFIPDIALVLGSGLGDLADETEINTVINYSELPDFPVSTAPTHKGCFIFGNMENKKVAVMQGRVGDLMIIRDHISSFVPSPLIGKNDNSLGLRFPDMSEVYSKKLNDIIKQTAINEKIDIKEGTYLQFRGPNFETPAEIKMAGLIGADAVGMSTAIEAQAAKHCGMEVLPILPAE